MTTLEAPRCDRAKALLLDTVLPLETVAYRAGFQSDEQIHKAVAAVSPFRRAVAVRGLRPLARGKGSAPRPNGHRVPKSIYVGGFGFCLRVLNRVEHQHQPCFARAGNGR